MSVRIEQLIMLKHRPIVLKNCCLFTCVVFDNMKKKSSDVHYITYTMTEFETRGLHLL